MAVPAAAALPRVSHGLTPCRVRTPAAAPYARAVFTTALDRGRAGEAGTAPRFRREKYVPKGGPDGGDGGRGGDVVLIADPDLRDLSRVPLARRFQGRRGGNGGGAASTAPTAQTSSCACPSGRRCCDEEGGSSPTSRTRRRASSRRAAARAAAATAASRRRRARRRASPRRASPARRPRSSCGSSCSPTRRSSASRTPASPRCCGGSRTRRPKVADYPFTTLQPVLGTVDSPDGRQLTVADVPGPDRGRERGRRARPRVPRPPRAGAAARARDRRRRRRPGRAVRTIDRELSRYGAGLESARRSSC